MADAKPEPATTPGHAGPDGEPAREPTPQERRQRIAKCLGFYFNDGIAGDREYHVADLLLNAHMDAAVVAERDALKESYNRAIEAIHDLTIRHEAVVGAWAALRPSLLSRFVDGYVTCNVCLGEGRHRDGCLLDNLDRALGERT